MFGNNITKHNQGQNTGYEAQSLASGYALTTHALQPSVKNHFLLEEKKNAATTDYWFAAITKAKTAFSENNGGAVQISVFPSVGDTIPVRRYAVPAHDAQERFPRH